MAATHIVFGGTGGIGAAVVRKLASAGDAVAVAGRDGGRTEALAAEVGGLPLVLDATDADAVQRAVTDAAEALGTISGVVNCVGSVVLKPAHLTRPEEWDDVLATNLGSAFNVVRAAGRYMRDTGGSVVLVSSAAARIGLTNHEAIAAAKGGVEALTRSAAATYAKAGIRFNAVAPGLVRTKQTERITGHAAAAEASTAMHPLGRFGEPDDVASVITWLLRPEQGWVTGQVIGVDGGLASLKLH